VKLLSLTGHPTARPAVPGNNEGGAGLLLVWRSVAAASNWLSLDSVVAKRRAGRYLPSDRAWVKTKNRDYWRWELEREGVLKAPATIRLGQASRVYIRAWPVRTLPRCAISAQLDDVCQRAPTRRDLRPVAVETPLESQPKATFASRVGGRQPESLAHTGRHRAETMTVSSRMMR
jgi:hypothetical protein